MALFNALTDDTQFCKIVGYRQAEITNKMSKEEQSHLRKMKKLYALPTNRKLQEQNDAIADALMRGEDVSELINPK